MNTCYIHPHLCSTSPVFFFMLWKCDNSLKRIFTRKFVIVLSYIFFLILKVFFSNDIFPRSTCYRPHTIFFVLLVCWIFWGDFLSPAMHSSHCMIFSLFVSNSRKHWYLVWNRKYNNKNNNRLSSAFHVKIKSVLGKIKVSIHLLFLLKHSLCTKNGCASLVPSNKQQLFEKLSTDEDAVQHLFWAGVKCGLWEGKFTHFWKQSYKRNIWT
jgi:hypothetical protein